MAGYAVTLIDINNAIGRQSKALRDDFAEIMNFKVWLDATPDATLLAAPINMPQGDIDKMRSAYGDHAQLNNIRLGLANLSVAKDFTTFAKQLTGIN